MLLQSPCAIDICNILAYISSANPWTSGDSPLADLIKDSGLCLFLGQSKTQLAPLEKIADLIYSFQVMQTGKEINRWKKGEGQS